MKKILYITNNEMPYKTKFFNELSKYCDLQVIYEFDSNTDRNTKWRKSIKQLFKYESLQKYHRKMFKIIRIINGYIKKGYDTIIFGCVNNKQEVLLIRYFRKKANVYINLDGELFLNRGLKTYIKKYVLSGVKGYLSAGVNATDNLKKAIKKENAFSYHFSSMTAEEIINNSKNYRKNKRQDYFLIVSRYSKEKGIDIVLKVAKKHPDIIFKFTGMGDRTNRFIKKVNKMGLKNVVAIPFLQKKELGIEYSNCKALILPSVQECWGLVVNEAASYGTPIVSTYGSGAAIELLKPEYNFFLAKPKDAESLNDCINKFLEYSKVEDYSDYLVNISNKYSIENMVDDHLNALNISSGEV